MHDLMVEFNESLPVDKALYKADIQGSITFAKGLRKVDLLSENELSQIIQGIGSVEKEWDEGKFLIKAAIDEGIHTASERRLSELIGSGIAGKLHIGRSRNEQIATDMRLWARGKLAGLAAVS